MSVRLLWSPQTLQRPGARPPSGRPGAFGFNHRDLRCADNVGCLACCRFRPLACGSRMGRPAPRVLWPGVSLLGRRFACLMEGEGSVVGLVRRCIERVDGRELVGRCIRGWPLHHLVRCNGCRKTTYFLSADLAKLFSEDRGDREPLPFPRSRCHTDEMLQVSLRSIADGDYEHLEVRRPGPAKHIQTWRTVRLGDPA